MSFAVEDILDSFFRGNLEKVSVDLPKGGSAQDNHAFGLQLWR